MAYKNQNYMTNVALKEQADQAQKDYVAPEQQEEQPKPQGSASFMLVSDEASYNAALTDNTSGLSKYYAKYPREDGIDAEGNPVHSLDVEVVGHSWEAAITAPTDPAETSTFPWVCASFDNFDGTMEIKYDGETKLTEEIVAKNTFWILSVPNDLGMTDYRLVWGTGAAGEKTFDASKLSVTFTPKTE